MGEQNPTTPLPQPETELAISLSAFLTRVLSYLTLVEQSLRTEFLHDHHAVEEWAKTLATLEDSLFPVYQLLRNPRNSTGPFAREAARRLPSFAERLKAMRGLLNNTELPPANRLFGLLTGFRWVRAALVAWCKDLQEQYGERLKLCSDNSTLFCDKARGPSRLGLLRAKLDEAESEISNGEEMAICEVLRRAFFLLYYTAVVYPEEWTKELHERLLYLHQQALDAVPSGLARESIQDRVGKLQQYDQATFMRMAMEQTREVQLTW